MTNAITVEIVAIAYRVVVGDSSNLGWETSCLFTLGYARMLGVARYAMETISTGQPMIGQSMRFLMCKAPLLKLPNLAHWEKRSDLVCLSIHSETGARRSINSTFAVERATRGCLKVQVSGLRKLPKPVTVLRAHPILLGGFPDCKPSSPALRLTWR